LLLGHLGPNSSLATVDVAALIQKQLASVVCALWLHALVRSSVIHHLQLLQEKLYPVFDVLLGNLNFASRTNVAGDQFTILFFFVVNFWEIK
jgi:hypothetical protein